MTTDYSNDPRPSPTADVREYDTITTTYRVVDNVSGHTIREMNDRDHAYHLCRGLNIEAGPGGRYSVREITT